MPHDRTLAERMEPYLDGKHSVSEISAKTGQTVSSIYALLRRNQWQMRVRIVNRHKTSGIISDVHLPHEIAAWVARQCPAGLRADEMITAIVTDAFFEAQEKT